MATRTHTQSYAAHPQPYTSTSTSTSGYPLNQTSPDPYDLDPGPNSIPHISKKSDWDDEIVPALRRKLESQSQTLGKRMSRIQASDNWNSNSSVGVRRDRDTSEMDPRFQQENSATHDERYGNGIKEAGSSKKKKSQRRNGASESNAMDLEDDSGTAINPSSGSGIHSTDSYLESFKSNSKSINKGRKTEPIQSSSSNHQSKQTHLGYGQPSTFKSHHNQFNHQESNLNESDVGNQSFPTIQSNQEIYDPEEEPAGAEARKEYRIRTQSQPLAIRNSSALKAAKDRAKKLKLEQESRTGEYSGDGNRDRDREYPPSSSRKILNQEEGSFHSKVPRKVPSLGDTQHSIQHQYSNSNSNSPNNQNHFNPSKIPRPLGFDSENSKHSVRSERSSRIQPIEGGGGVVGSNLNIPSRNGKESNHTDSESIPSPPNSPNLSTNTNGFQSSQSSNQINNNSFVSTSTPIRNHQHLNNNSGLSRSDSRKAARTPTKAELEEFGPLGGNGNSSRNAESLGGIGMGKKFGTAPSGLSLLKDSSNLNSNSNRNSNQKERNSKSSNQSNQSSSIINNNNNNNNNQPTTNQTTEFISSSISSSSSESQLSKIGGVGIGSAEEDIRSNFYTTQQAKKWDDQLLPVVAKRLQAEAMRNARMSQFEGLVDTWDVNGLPLSYKEWNSFENDQNIRNLKEEEEELKKLKEEELENLVRFDKEKKLKAAEDSKRRKSLNFRDRDNEIEMLRLEHKNQETKARRSSEGARKLIHQNQLDQANKKKIEEEKKKKNEAGCCQCSIM